MDQILFLVANESVPISFGGYNVSKFFAHYAESTSESDLDKYSVNLGIKRTIYYKNPDLYLI